MTKFFLKAVTVSSIAAALTACSGSSGGGGTAASSSTLQAAKMTCSGSVCLGSGSSFLPQGIMPRSVTGAVTMYNDFNDTMIPALNEIIGKVEEGVAQGGAESCDDIELGFSGAVTVGGVSYNVKTRTTSQTAPSYFTTQAMSKGLAGQVASNNVNFIEGDVACGAGTNANPLVARILAQNATQKLNAWFEKGDSKHIRILMAVKSGSNTYGAWFKTDDGDTFEVVLASEGTVYKAVGKKSLGLINYSEVVPPMFTMGVGDTCLNATTGNPATGCETLGNTADILPTGIPSSLVTYKGPVAMTTVTFWEDISTANVDLNTPSF